MVGSLTLEPVSLGFTRECFDSFRSVSTRDADNKKKTKADEEEEQEDEEEEEEEEEEEKTRSAPPLRWNFCVRVPRCVERRHGH